MIGTEVGASRALAAVVVVCLGFSGGCHLLRYAGGPRWSQRAEPIEAGGADLRDRDELTFLILGDNGTGKRDQYEVGERMARECEARGGCDFALMLGDNIYYTGVRPARAVDGETIHDAQFETKFEAPYRALGRLDFWVVPGNHDWRGSIEAQIAYTRASERWRMPSPDYAVPRLPDWIHVYGLDTVALLADRDEQQVERARDALCGRPGWRLLSGHHPVYTSGKHAARDGSTPGMPDRLLEPLIERCGVHFYLAGHDHHQEHLTAPGFEQIVQGAAAKLRGLRVIEGRPTGVRQLFVDVRFGFGVARATPEMLELRFFGYDDTSPYGELHCRRFRLAEFADPATRSEACTEG
jgi:hypothetical protein